MLSPISQGEVSHSPISVKNNSLSVEEKRKSGIHNRYPVKVVGNFMIAYRLLGGGKYIGRSVCVQVMAFRWLIFGVGCFGFACKPVGPQAMARVPEVVKLEDGFGDSLDSCMACVQLIVG